MWPDTRCYDDWSLALNVTRRGWRTEKNTTPITTHRHTGDHRTTGAETKAMPHKWNVRTYAILTLLAGRNDCLRKWQHWLLNADTPPHCELWIVNNAGLNKPAFTENLHLFLTLPEVRDKYTIRTIDAGEPCDTSIDQWEKHRHVAKLYNLALMQINTDMLVMLEDDVVPPHDGLRTLAEAYDCKRHIAGISGVYASRTGVDRITGARAFDYWHDIPKRQELPANQVIPLGFIAGGFTLWNMGFVRECLPFYFEMRNGTIPAGWDTQLSIRARAMGGRLHLHTGVNCAHNLEAQ
jgi:hypothetical protein